MERLGTFYHENFTKFVQSHKILTLTIGIGFVMTCAAVVVIIILKRMAHPPPNSPNQPPPPPSEKPLPPGSITGLDVSMENV